MGGASDEQGSIRRPQIEGMASTNDADRIRRKVGSLEGVKFIDADISSGRSNYI